MASDTKRNEAKCLAAIDAGRSNAGEMTSFERRGLRPLQKAGVIECDDANNFRWRRVAPRKEA